MDHCSKGTGYKEKGVVFLLSCKAFVCGAAEVDLFLTKLSMVFDGIYIVRLGDHLGICCFTYIKSKLPPIPPIVTSFTITNTTAMFDYAETHALQVIGSYDVSVERMKVDIYYWRRLCVVQGLYSRGDVIKFIQQNQGSNFTGLDCNYKVLWHTRENSLKILADASEFAVVHKQGNTLIPDVYEKVRLYYALQGFEERDLHDLRVWSGSNLTAPLYDRNVILGYATALANIFRKNGYSYIIFFRYLMAGLLLRGSNRDNLMVIQGVCGSGKSLISTLLGYVVRAFSFTSDFLSPEQLAAYTMGYDVAMINDASIDVLHFLSANRNLLEGETIVGAMKYGHPTPNTTPVGYFITTNEPHAMIISERFRELKSRGKWYSFANTSEFTFPGGRIPMEMKLAFAGLLISAFQLDPVCMGCSGLLKDIMTDDDRYACELIILIILIP